MPVSFQDHSWAVGSVIEVTGLVLFSVGIILAFWARITLGNNWGMPMSQKQDPALITSGPYRCIRHPIYSGVLLMVLGSTLDVNSYWAIVFLLATFYFVYSAFAEERRLVEAFPKAYPAYRSRTKMFIPFLF